VVVGMDIWKVSGILYYMSFIFFLRILHRRRIRRKGIAAASLE